MDEKVYFQAKASNAQGVELWETDGTPEGTKLVEDINTGGDSDPKELTPLGTKLYFTADGGSGRKIYVHNPDPKPTENSTEAIGGTSPTNINSLFAHGHLLFFSASDPTHGQELWIFDSSKPANATNPKLLKDINPATSNSSPYSFVSAWGYVFFQATTAKSGAELWRSDGTSEGTRLAKDIKAGTGNSLPMALRAYRGKVYFNAEGDNEGKELWVHEVIAEKVWTQKFD